MQSVCARVHSHSLTHLLKLGSSWPVFSIDRLPDDLHADQVVISHFADRPVNWCTGQLDSLQIDQFVEMITRNVIGKLWLDNWSKCNLQQFALCGLSVNKSCSSQVDQSANWLTVNPFVHNCLITRYEACHGIIPCHTLPWGHLSRIG